MIYSFPYLPTFQTVTWPKSFLSLVLTEIIQKTYYFKGIEFRAIYFLFMDHKSYLLLLIILFWYGIGTLFNNLQFQTTGFLDC